MTVQYNRTRRQLERFLSALFLPDELIELRFIESWASGGKKKSRVVRPAQWLLSPDIVSQHDELTAFAKDTRANIYLGVCPRRQAGDADDQSIQTVRCVWCDIDHVTPRAAYDRWQQAQIPWPSIVVNSGSGVHGYWLLDRDLTSQINLPPAADIGGDDAGAKLVVVLAALARRRGDVQLGIVGTLGNRPRGQFPCWLPAAHDILELLRHVLG